MTSQNDVKYDENYTLVHNHGFVGIVTDLCSGSDETIERSARVSYGKGTRAVTDTRSLIRYLMRHKHMTPFEMGDVTFHIKCPIFVARQLFRHRTCAFSEYSGRYSEMTDEVYFPKDSYIRFQSETNRQGRGEELEDGFAMEETKKSWKEVNTFSRVVYNAALKFGITRELARAYLPLGLYTEFYMKMNLRNYFHMAGLRVDSHAQQECRDYIIPTLSMVSKRFPLAFEAWEDYGKNAVTFSRMEMDILKEIVETSGLSQDYLEARLETLGCGKREKSEFFRKVTNNELV